MAEADYKLCYTCKQSKLRSEFPKHGQKSDGLSPSCKPCNTAARHAYNANLDPSVKAERVRRKAEYDAVYVKENEKRLSVYRRQYYLDNVEEKKLQAKLWFERHPDRRKAIANSYKHRRRSVERAGMTGRELAVWTKAQKKICYWCGVKCADEYHIDHYEPLSKGGKHEAGNLVIACRPCNYRKHAKDPLDFAKEVGRLL